MDNLKVWWEEAKVTRNAGFVFHAKLKFLRGNSKVWVKENMGKVEQKIASLESLILDFDCEEEEQTLTE